MTEQDDLERELRRLVDRLSTMPLAKAERCTEQVHATAALIVERTRTLDASIPADAALPHVGVSAVAAQLEVVGRDYLAAVRTVPDADSSDVFTALVELRRSLP